MSELILYSPIWDFTAESYIEKLQQIDSKEDVTTRVNSPGGSVFAGWGIIASLQDRKGKNIMKVDGVAASMAMYMLLFADEVHALDVSKFMIHRADGYVEDDEDQALLDGVNSQLRAKMEERIDSVKFESITGVSIEDIFTAKKRKDVWLTAKQAKQIGLVTKINRLNTSEIKSFSDKLVAFSDFEAGITNFVEEDTISIDDFKSELKKILS